MKRIHIIVYHCLYWIYRVVSTSASAYFIYHESWYKGAYVVQLVLMPFFYSNYALLIPWLIEKKRKYFIAGSLLWLISFVWVYSVWTIYQRNILYGEELWKPDYIETFNNLIYIWLISTAFCLFEYWIRNLNKNQALVMDRKNHVLKSEQNKMLNHLLADYLRALKNSKPEEIPHKILMVSDFFKYVLYNRSKEAQFQTEKKHLEQYEELKNSNRLWVRIQCDNIPDFTMVHASPIIAVIDRLAAIVADNALFEVSVSVNKTNKVVLSIVMPLDKRIQDKITEEFDYCLLPQDGNTGNLVFSIVRYLAGISIVR